MNNAKRPHPYQPLDGGAARLPWLWLGTWSLGGEGFGRVDADEARNLIALAWREGIRHFDTAGFYAHGKSERLLATALKGHRKEVFLSTKGGLCWQGREVRHDARPETLRKACIESMQRLATDYIDLFQLHWPDPSVPLAESIDALRILQHEGMIRYWGVGNLDPEQVRTHLPEGARIPHQVHHNPLYRSDATLQAGRENERAYHCIVSPLEQGLLGQSKTSRGFEALGKRDIRRRNPCFHSAAVVDWLRVFQSLSPSLELPRAGLITLWLLASDGVDAVVPGPKSKAQLRELLAHLEWIGAQEKNESGGIECAALARRIEAFLPRQLWRHLNSTSF